jgi:hypothetical protein
VTAFLVLNDEGVERFGRNLADFYMKMGFLQKVGDCFGRLDLDLLPFDGVCNDIFCA